MKRQSFEIRLNSVISFVFVAFCQPRILRYSARDVTDIFAIYVASYVGRKSEVRKCQQRDLKMLGCFVINLLNNKTIILLKLAEYRMILADEAVGRVG